MEEAFVFINSELGEETQAIESLRQIAEVYSVVGVFGVYDIIARVRTLDTNQMQEAVSKIRAAQFIKATLTMNVIQN